MDNVSYHSSDAIWYHGDKVIRRENIPKLLEDAGINVLFLPPYASPLNPIGR